MIRKMNAIPAVGEEFVRNREREHAACDRADRGGRKHGAAGMHAAWDLRRRVAAVSAEGFAG